MRGKLTQLKSMSAKSANPLVLTSSKWLGLAKCEFLCVSVLRRDVLVMMLGMDIMALSKPAGSSFFACFSFTGTRQFGARSNCAQPGHSGSRTRCHTVGNRPTNLGAGRSVGLGRSRRQTFCRIRDTQSWPGCWNFLTVCSAWYFWVWSAEF
ncbi:hypothetical protein BpHYR1_030500 [Brachionus plicatilis]|uniref:Uncharacterized protein n=1 Tax=Brachionus plicatilis TaxID=10195 RepID=A0A3M7R8E3_BRAPC|nr:hypothetical protein BpHYR1_030500 [Brachionus plicatilis]